MGTDRNAWIIANKWGNFLWKSSGKDMFLVSGIYSWKLTGHPRGKEHGTRDPESPLHSCPTLCPVWFPSPGLTHQTQLLVLPINGREDQGNHDHGRNKRLRNRGWYFYYRHCPRVAGGHLEAGDTDKDAPDCPRWSRTSSRASSTIPALTSIPKTDRG